VRFEKSVAVLTSTLGRLHPATLAATHAQCALTLEAHGASGSLASADPRLERCAEAFLSRARLLCGEGGDVLGWTGPGAAACNHRAPRRGGRTPVSSPTAVHADLLDVYTGTCSPAYMLDPTEHIVSHRGSLAAGGAASCALAAVREALGDASGARAALVAAGPAAIAAFLGTAADVDAWDAELGFTELTEILARHDALPGGAIA
jgi:hypothetical protein